MPRLMAQFAVAASLVCTATTAQATDLVTFNLTNPVQTITTAGGKLTFNASIAAPLTNTGLEYLAGDSFNVASPGTLDDSVFYNTPLYLAPGQSYVGSIFTLFIPAGLSGKTYSGSFSILGGSSSGSVSTLGTQSFSVSVVAPFPVGSVPEPTAWAMMILGMGAIGYMTRRQKVITRVSYAA